MNSGSQQADLAPVSDQPAEHWEQQAAQREAEEPAAPTDPLGAQPQAEAEQPDAAPAPTSAATVAPPATEPAPTLASAPSQPAPASPTSSANESSESSSRDASTDAIVDHDTTLAVGGEMAWSDPSGEHARSGEVSVDLAQANTLGGAASALSQGSADSSPTPMPTDTIAAVDAAAQGALAQAAVLAGGGLAIAQSSVLGEALGQGSALSTALENGALPALDSLTSSLGAVTSATDALLDDGISEGIDALAAVPALEDASPSLNALPHLPDAAPLDAVSAPSGLLAALFTPDVGQPADLLGGGATETAVEDVAPDLHLTDLTGGFDDHPDLGLGLGL